MKFKKKLRYILIIPLVMIAIHFVFYFQLKSIFHADKSVNPNATSNFIHATDITMFYIEPLRSIGLQYDSFIISPFVSARDYFFNKGKIYINKENSEDVAFWVINYANYYGFKSGDSNNNTGIINLKPTIRKELNDKIYQMIVKFGQYEIQGVHSDMFLDKEQEFTALVGGYLLGSSYVLYEGKNNDEKKRNYFLDDNVTKEIENIYIYYRDWLNHNKKNKYFNASFKYGVLSDLVFRQYLKDVNLCNYKYTNEYIDLILYLVKWINSDNNKTIDEVRIIKHLNETMLSKNTNDITKFSLNELNIKCPKYKTQTDKILKIKGMNYDK